MTAPIFIGDELAAAGWRLAGVRVRTPSAGQEVGALTRACTEAPLVLISAPVAAAMAQAPLRAALSALSPLVLVVPDLQGEVPLPDLAARLRGQLGLEA